MLDLQFYMQGNLPRLCACVRHLASAGEAQPHVGPVSQHAAQAPGEEAPEVPSILLPLHTGRPPYRLQWSVPSLRKC